MDATALRELQAPAKEMYCERPEAAFVSLNAKASLRRWRRPCGRTVSLSEITHPQGRLEGHDLPVGLALGEGCCGSETEIQIETLAGLDPAPSDAHVGSPIFGG